MKRVCLPEMLDALPPDHPDAQHSRRDLRIINVIMRNRGWLVSSVKASVRPGERILEIGAGTGELAMALQAEGLPVDGLDRWPRPPGWPEGSAWHQGDLRTFGGYASYPVILANLILHQFSDGDLAGIGAVLRRDARVVIACEPERWRFTQAGDALLRLGRLLPGHLLFQQGQVLHAGGRLDPFRSGCARILRLSPSRR